MSCFEEAKIKVALDIQKEGIKLGLEPNGTVYQLKSKKISKSDKWGDCYRVSKDLNKLYGYNIAKIQHFSDQDVVVIDIPAELVNEYIKKENDNREGNKLNLRPPTAEELDGLYYWDEGEVKNLDDVSSDYRTTLFEAETADPNSNLKYNSAAYIEFKRGLISQLKTKIEDLKIKRANKRYRKDKNIVRAIFELETLQEQLELEMSELLKKENKTNLDLIFSFYKVDLQRAIDLANSQNIKNFIEAERIVDFYSSLGEFNNEKSHPLFDNGLIYDQEGKLIPEMEPIRKRFQDIANDFKNRTESMMNTKKKEILRETILSNRKFQQLYKGATEQEADRILNQTEIEDISWVDLWISNTASNIFGEDSLMPQIAKNELIKEVEEENSYIGGFLEEIDRVQERAEKELPLKKFLFLRAKDYGIFYQDTTNNKKTGRLVSIFSNKWYNAYEAMKSQFNTLLNKAKDTNLSVDYKDAYKYKNDWLRKNAEILHIVKIKDIENHFLAKHPDFAGLFSKYSDEEKERYTTWLKSMLGRQYEETIQKQIESIENYKEWYDQFEAKTLAENEIEKISDLEPNKAFDFQLKIIRNSPFELSDSWNDKKEKNTITFGAKEYTSYMNYNMFIPKKTMKTMKNSKYDYKNKKLTYDIEEYSSGFYDRNFDKIQNNDALYDMWKVLYKSVEYINDSFFDSYTRTVKGQIPVFEKGLMDTILQNEKGLGIVTSLKWLKEWVIRKAAIPISRINEKEASDKESINKNMNADSFGEINNLVKLKVAEMERNEGTTIPENSDAYTKIRESITNEYYELKSKDLLKNIRTALNYAAEYRARQNTLPIQLLMKEHYESIKRKKKENDPGRKGTVAEIFKKYSKHSNINEERRQAKSRYESWFNEKVKGNFETDVWGNYKTNVPPSSETKGLIRLMTTGRVFTEREKEILKQLENAIAATNIELSKMDEENQNYDILIEKKKKLEDMRMNLGSVLSMSAIINSLMDWIRFNGLAWNIKSLFTNRMQGWISDMYADATGAWFTTGNLVKANAFLSWSTPRSYMKKLRGNKEYEKFSLFFEKTKIMQDASNELQKNSFKSGLKGINKLNPFYMPISHVEFKNQGALVLAKLMDVEIKNEERTVKVFENNEFPAFDVVDGVLRLKEEFRTEENINTWEKMNSPEFIDLKSIFIEMISSNHGDFSKYGGMKAKTTTVGKAVTMFKTWLPKQIQLRWGAENPNMEAGTVTKGFYRSHTPMTAAITAGVAGLAIGNPLLTGILAAGAYGWAYIHHKKNNIEMEVKGIKQLVLIGKNLTRKMLGIPLNVVGIKALTSSDIDKIYTSNNKIDNRNLKAIIVDISVMLGFLLAKIMMKSLMWDDDPETQEEKRKRRRYNLMENQLSSLLADATQYIDFRGAYQSQVKLSIMTWFDNVFKTVNETDEMFEEGNKFMERLGKLTIPSGLQDIQNLNMSKYMERDFTPGQWLDEVFIGEEKENQTEYEAIRKKAKEDMTEKLKNDMSSDEFDKLTDRDIWKEVNKKYRTRKKDESYEDMLELYDTIDEIR